MDCARRTEVDARLSVDSRTLEESFSLELLCRFSVQAREVFARMMLQS